MKKSKRKPGTWLMTGGLLLIAAALLLTGYNLWDEYRAGEETGRVLEQMPVLSGKSDVPGSLNLSENSNSFENPEFSEDPGEQEIPDYILNPDMEMPVVKIKGNSYIGTLEIPVLDLSLPVMSDWTYPKLRIAPCRYAGTAYTGNFVIAAHNYRTHFGRLGELNAGERVTFTDVDGNVFFYEVAEIQTLAPTAVEDMVADDWDLSLFTCTLGGRTRLTVRCEAVK